MKPHFRYCCSVWGCCGATSINWLRILIESSFNAPSGPLIKRLGWKTIHELVDEESRLIVCKSINGLAPQYLCIHLTRNSFDNFYIPRNTATIWIFQRKRQKMTKNRSHIEERNSGISYQLNQSSHLRFVLWKAISSELEILLVVGQ